MRLLVTAFEPFGGEKINPSAEIAKHLKAPQGTELHVCTLPVSFRYTGEKLKEAVSEIHPDMVLCLGQAGGRTAITPEAVGINRMSTRSADGARLGHDDYGFEADDLEIVPGGPAAYFSPFPVRKMTVACNAAGVKSELSYTAGTYLCNYVLYSLLHENIRAGFVHVPFLIAQSERIYGDPSRGMPLEDMIRGVQAMLDVLAEG